MVKIARSLLCITLLWASHQQAWPQAFTNAAHTAPDQQDAPSQQQIGPSPLPVAQPVDQPAEGQAVRLEADSQQKQGSLYTLSGNVIVRTGDYVLRSDKILYNSDSGIATSPGRLQMDGGVDHEHVIADSAEVDLKRQTARFYNVTGTVTITRKDPEAIYGSGHPFLFTGKEVVKEGPERYVIYSGMVTSCDLPRPDWKFETHRTEVAGETAKLYGAAFRLVDIPLFYFPYATHALDTNGRQTGLLIPTLGTSSSKGLIVGEEFYWAINRSMDLTLGLDYYSLRGFAERGVFHYRGQGLDFVHASASALQDRGQPGTGIDQGGQDVLLSGRHDFTPNTRAAGDLEYLSSYIYREAFAENFTTAVNSEVKSTAYLAHNDHGYALDGILERYQNFEDTTNGDEIRILHVPSLEFDALDHPLGAGFSFNGNAAFDGLRRSEPGFATGGITERLNLHPQISWQGYSGGWSVRPYAGAYETFYSRSQLPGDYDVGVGYVVPIERDEALNRAAGEAGVDIFAPAVERTFVSGDGTQWRHVLEPEAHYRFVGGIDNFQNVLRFDETDILSDTNEMEYGLTQRLFRKHTRAKPCAIADVKCVPYSQEKLTWFVGQKYFFDPTFGGAVVPGQRNVLETTVMFSGAAFLDTPRYSSPVISRLRISGSDRTDIEWDADYDPRRGQLIMSNVFADVRAGLWFGGVGHADLIEPDEQRLLLGTTPDLKLDQIRLTLGYGGPTKPGFSGAINNGFDINLDDVQYGAVQGSYNWDCCGLTVEYRRFALGSVRNENQYRFNLTLAGVGTAGNLKKAERLF